MIDVVSIFKYRTRNADKLLKYGFECLNGTYKKAVPIMRGQFDVLVSVNDAGKVGFKVYDTETNEEYALVHVVGAAGGFVGEVLEECEKVLSQISENCFDIQRLKAEQTMRMTEYIKTEFSKEPEFLWEKYPSYAAFRADNGKWFAVLGEVEREKLGLIGDGTVEMINLKDTPENVEKRISDKRFSKAYHMNKKHWFTVPLDGTVSDEEIKALIKISYDLVLCNN